MTFIKRFENVKRLLKKSKYFCRDYRVKEQLQKILKFKCAFLSANDDSKDQQENGLFQYQTETLCQVYFVLL